MLVSTSPAAGQEEKKIRVPFISVQPKQHYKIADQMLADYLHKETGLVFYIDDYTALDYHQAIEEVVQRGNLPYVARLTPYPCVVAELRGAQFKILATYSSRDVPKQDNKPALTYRSYFVVNSKQAGFSGSDNPTLSEFDDFLRKGNRKFWYHDKFSTSSFFIPLDYFRRKKAFRLEKNQAYGDGITSLEVMDPLPLGSSSSDLLPKVENGSNDFAAVWDGTKQEYEKAHPNSSLRFIPIDQDLPNDLFVVSSSLPAKHLKALSDAIRKMPCDKPCCVFPGDFECWHLFEDAREARVALGDLRRLAVAPPIPVTIRISMASEENAGAENQDRSSAYLDAARQAVRVSGTEFVLQDPDDTNLPDIDWELKVIHDGALEITSFFNNKDDPKHEKIKPQIFPISFTDAGEELTRRIGGIIQNRLDRIRYVWPFENGKPIVLRDVGFVPKKGSSVWVQRVIWTDPKRNVHKLDDLFEATVKETYPHEFQLNREQFPKDLDIDPMSNSAFRVILEPPATEQKLFHYLTVAFVALFALGGIASGVDLYRARRSPRG